MAKEVLSTAELTGIVRQILDSEEREAVEVQDPRFAFYDCFHVPWQETELLFCSAVERGLVNCPVCGGLGGMGDLILCGHGAEAELRFEHLHILEIHAGRVGGELVLDIDHLQKVIGLDNVPLVEQVDEYYKGVLMTLWEIQNAVISQYHLNSRDMNNERREGYHTTWQDRTIRVWFSPDKGRSQPCPICGVDDWTHALEMSLAEGETHIDISAEVHHLMEVHGMTEVPDRQVWNNPGDFAKLRDFLSVLN